MPAGRLQKLINMLLRWYRELVAPKCDLGKPVSPYAWQSRGHDRVIIASAVGPELPFTIDRQNRARWQRAPKG
jgi:hypothetical protein